MHPLTLSFNGDHMQLISRFLPKSEDPDLAKNQAVFTAIFLIFGGCMIIPLLYFVLPEWLSNNLPNSMSPDSKKNIIAFAPILLTLACILFSYDMINAMIVSAIKADVNLSKRSMELDILSLEEEFEEYKKKIAGNEEVKNQELEFRLYYNSLMRRKDEYIDQPMSQSFRKRFVRDAIIRGLAHNDDLLDKIATIATKAALNIGGVDGEIAAKDERVIFFYHDIHIYLKAWLMHSISNDRIMDVTIIQQRCPNNTIEYISALKHIRQILIRTDDVMNCIEHEYRSEAVQLLGLYLDKLIAQLQLIQKEVIKK